MITPEKIDALMDGNVEARDLVATVKDKLLRFARASQERAGEELVGEAALDIIASVVDPTRKLGASPPWPPHRYKLDTERTGTTKKLVLTDHISGEDFKLYVTLNFYENGEPAELFVTKPSESSSTLGALMDALVTAVSIGLQFGVPWDTFSAKMVRTNFPPQGNTKEDDRDLFYVSSILDYVFRWTEKAIQRQRALTQSERSAASGSSEANAPSKS